MRHTFYEAFSRFPPRDAGTAAHLARACRQLGIASPRLDRIATAV
jgi:hypothetical protein